MSYLGVPTRGVATAGAPQSVGSGDVVSGVVTGPDGSPVADAQVAVYPLCVKHGESRNGEGDIRQFLEMNWFKFSGHRRWLPAGVAGALAILVLAFIGVVSDSPGPGPLERPDKSVWTSTGLALKKPAQIDTITAFLPHNRGNQQATIDRVELRPSSDGVGIHLVFAFVVRQSMKNYSFVASHGSARENYNEGHLTPAVKSSIPAHARKAYTLGVVVRAPSGFDGLPRDKFAVANGIQVNYHVGSPHYVDTWPTQIVLCHGSCTRFSKKQWPDPPDVS